MLSFSVLLPLFSSIVSALPSTPLKRDDSSLLTSDIDKFIQSVLTDWGTPGGVAVAAVVMNEDGSWTVDTKGYGNATSDGTLIDSDTMLCIGSNSKQYNAISTGLLLSNKSLEPRLTTTTKMSSIFPGSWALMNDFATAESTMIDLFSHRTGVPRHDNMYSLDDTVDDLLNRVKYLKPSLPFRDQYQYSNIMYAIMSHLPTALLPSKIPFTRYVKQHIFDPLGLSATYSPMVAAQGHVLAQGFGRDGANRTENVFAMGTPRALEYWSKNVTEDGNAMSGAGGIIMHANDVAVWLQTLLLQGANPKTGEQVIPAEVLKSTSTGVSVVPETSVPPGTDTPLLYGAGQEIGTYGGYLTVGHEGDVAGFHSAMIRVPSAKLAVAVLTNDDTYGPSFIQVIKYRLLDVLLGLNSTDWNSVYQQTVKAKYAASLAVTPPPSSPSPPSVAYTELAGTYSNGAYGELELCYLSDSSSCQDLLAGIPNAGDERPTLVAQWNKLWASHVFMRHFDGDTWNLTLLDKRVSVQL
ncbi:beta-lactamase/transpeptidase-like protein [Mucidula mucida]|nr:beta-lactamase/transpeptidase-like protein [Mucidula mucida]